MNRPPYFAFYPIDFASDLNVEAMSTLQVGAYMLLICKAWQADPPASLPNDDQILARLARMDAVDWAEAKAGVLAAFTLGADGRWHQKRLRREYDRASQLIKKRSQDAKDAARKRWDAERCDGNASGNATAMPRHCGGNAIQTQIEDQDETKTKGKDPPNPPKPGGDGRFAEFWAAYPKKAKRLDAVKAFGKLAPDDALFAVILAAVEAQKRSDQWTKDGGRFVPHAATWLNGHRWEDEVDPPGPHHANGRPQTKAERDDAYFARQAESILGGHP